MTPRYAGGQSGPAAGCGDGEQWCGKDDGCQEERDQLAPSGEREKGLPWEEAMSTEWPPSWRSSTGCSEGKGGEDADVGQEAQNLVRGTSW